MPRAFPRRRKCRGPYMGHVGHARLMGSIGLRNHFAATLGHPGIFVDLLYGSQHSVPTCPRKNPIQPFMVD